MTEDECANVQSTSPNKKTPEKYILSMYTALISLQENG